MPLKIFYISSEVDPFSSSYLLSKISRKIAVKFQDNPDIEIRLLHPKYGFISERKYILREVIRLRDFPVIFDNKEKLVSIKSAFIPESRAQIYFLEDENYFKPVLSYFISQETVDCLKIIMINFCYFLKLH